ncbi:hypothetical protein X727_20250 [Mesorhizobium sp. L103C119B0]|uniref:hypothetical protein n=1 Tax=unclassified Mesorhizobium TaxID=325217 RepID=UPI0003CF47CA|nr:MULTISPECIES: hypothetical protein [unclassified Mesorhizobium]ESX07397.1 hypothetical protein X768_27200 [Mesorhizobium sp. LSJC265A00]ESX99828.1 hypothetical protein X753_30115 [Mesorhizobium sp. LNJC399B00]ESZ68954.1 hypothetical protein X727_20250 [Mesorhizobium sp. L103C119B0]WJI71637.1 hypothetical protein NLY36_12910 [Mesorhizobium sp. C399B]
MQKAMVRIRPFERQDVGAVLALMRALAVFEGYDDKLRVTEANLIEHGLGPSPRFGVLVAEREGVIVGIAVHYLIPLDLRPEAGCLAEGTLRH